jgi:RNA-directed DNA polymerase
MRTPESRILRKASVRFGEGRAEKCLQRQLAGRLLYFVMVFEDFADIHRVRRVLEKRMSRYGLSVHPEKTRMVDFRFKRPNGGRHPATQATTFTFLGFTHHWGLSRRGKHVIYQRTAKERYARALDGLQQWCKANRHRPVSQQHVELSRKIQGHYAYYGISGNSQRLRWYAHQAERIWHCWLTRRSRGQRFTWASFQALLRRYPIPEPRIVHSYTTAGKSSL